MGDKLKDYFMILGVHYTASQWIVKSVYKQLCKVHHPDIGGDKEKFQEIQEAYEILSNPVLRKKYEKKWLIWHSAFMNSFETDMIISVFDMSFLPARQSILEYMYFILNKDYESAYEMLSSHNKKKINKRDYEVWQSLIGEIHQLLEFDCIVESLGQLNKFGNDKGILENSLIFKVKVREKNLILNRIEEEFFLRKLVYEAGVWKIRLNDIDIKKIIKKYGKIIALNKRNKNIIKKMKPLIEDYYPTQELSLDIFIRHCEYEYERFIRYKNHFSIVKIQLNNNINRENMDKNIYELFEKHTRKIDAFSQYDRYCYLLILPETGLKKAEFVSKKISKLLEKNIEDLKGKISDINIITSENSNISVKEMFESIDIYL